MAARAALSTIYLLLIYFCCVSLQEASYHEDNYNDPNGYEDGDYLSMPQDYEENDNSDEDPEEDDNYDNPREEEADDENDEYGRTKVGVTEHDLYNGGIRDVHDHIMEDKHPNVEKKNKKKKKKKSTGKKKKISQHNKKNRNKQNTRKTSDPHTAAIPRLTPSASIQPIKPASVVKHEEESNHKHIETIINTASESPENDKHDVPPKEEFKNDQEKTDSLEQSKYAGLQESTQDKEGKNDAEKMPQKQIKMARLSDPDLEMNTLLQSEKFSHVRETQIRDYINSHFPGQDLQDDVLDMIDNLITSNLRNELRNKDSRLNRILHEKETKAQDGDQQSTTEPLLMEKVKSDTVDEHIKNIAFKQDPDSSLSSVADVTSKSVVVEPTPVLEDPQKPFEKHIPEAPELVEQSLSSYEEAITQAVEPTTSLSNVPTESSSVENIVDGSKVEVTSSLPVVEPSTTDSHKVKRKNLMKQALKGMHFNAHHLHDHHTDKQDATQNAKEESSSKDVNFDEQKSNHNTEEEEKRSEAVDVTSKNIEVPIDSEAANKESKNEDLVNEVEKKTEQEEAFDLKPPDYSKEEVFSNVLKKGPEVSPDAEGADSLPQQENLLPSDKKVDDFPSLSEQLKKDNIPSIKLPVTTQDQTNLQSEKETTGAANVSDVTETPPSNSDADSTAGNILPDEKPVSKGEEGKGEGFLGGLFDYFSSESAATDEKTGSGENKAEKTESTLMGINEVDETILIDEIDRTSDHKDIVEADAIKISLFSKHDRENEGEKDKPTITSAAENVETTESSPTESTAPETTTATTPTPTTEPLTTEPPTTTATLATETPLHDATILATEKHLVKESDTQASENPTLETTKSPTTQQSATPLSTASIEVPVTIVPSVKTEEVKEEKETITRLDDKTPNEKENDMKDMLKKYRESVDMDHEKAKYLPTGQNTKTEVKQTESSTTTSSSSKNEEASTSEILPDFDDDDPLKKLCQTHPTLQACKRKPTKKPQTELPLVSSPSTVSYVKSFTRWFNGTLYSIFVYLFTCLKMVSTTIVNSSLGMFLSVTGQTEASKNLSTYMDSVTLERFALFMVLLVNHVAFYWYFKNSSMGPQVKSITRSDTNTTNDLKLQELEENNTELEKKLSKETKQKEELEKKVVTMEDKMKNHLDEIKELKKKLEDEKANKDIIEKLQAATEEYKEKLASKEAELNNKTSSLNSKKEDLDNSKTEFKQLEDKFFYVIKELDTKDAAIMKMEDKEKELQHQISEKESTLSEKEETIDEQKNRIEVLLEEKLTLENNINEETKKSHSLEVEIQVLQESLLAVNKTHVDHETSSEFETVEEDEEIDADQLKADRLAKIMDATKTQAELKELTSELATCREELDRYKERVVDAEGKYMDVSTRYDSVYVEAGEVRKELEKKEIELTTIRKFFNDRENDYQKASASQSEELRILRKQVDSIGDNDKQINILMKQVQDLKDEIVKNEKVLKEQISAAEEQSHNSYIKMRTAVRECDEHKREKEIYRKRLLDIDMSPQFKKTSTPLSSKTSSERAVSPTNSNKSNDDNSGTESPRPTLPPPGPSPYASRMYPGMPPPFQHRPPFGMPMGPYGGPARPPFMSPMGQRPGGMTRIPTTAATSKEDQLQQMGTATLEQRPLLPPNPAALPPHLASPMRPMGGMYRMPPPGTPPMVRPPYGMPPGTPPMMRPHNTFAPGAQQLPQQPQSNVNTPSGNGKV